MKKFKIKEKTRKLASRAVFGIGAAAIGVIAVPTAILLGLIFLIKTSTDFFIKKLGSD